LFILSSNQHFQQTDSDHIISSSSVIFQFNQINLLISSAASFCRLLLLFGFFNYHLNIFTFHF